MKMKVSILSMYLNIFFLIFIFSLETWEQIPEAEDDGEDSGIEDYMSSDSSDLEEITETTLPKKRKLPKIEGSKAKKPRREK